MDETQGRLRIIGFEPFDAGSHRAVRESITRHSKHDWTWLTRPGRAWKWRMRLGAVELFAQAMQEGVFETPVDAVFVTSLMGLADLRGLMGRAACADIPCVLYMHENQAAYPGSDAAPAGEDWDANYLLTNLTSVLAADRVVFNSAWNRASLIAGIEDLLRHAPDTTLTNPGAWLDAHTEVIWPPVEPPPGAAGAGRASPNAGDPVRVAWPHRWEHDKGPDELLELATRHTESLNLRWTILGERFREVPPVMEEFRTRFADRIDHWGFIDDRAEYWRAVSAADWVLSTARHEFFGIAVVEALLAGCLPWLPDRLSYPELLPEVARGLRPMNPPDDPGAVRAAIRAHLEPALAPNAVARLDQMFIDVVIG